MSVAKAVYLICDRCQIAQERVGMSSVAEAREVARDDGWKSRGRIDLCEFCVAAEVRSTNTEGES